MEIHQVWLKSIKINKTLIAIYNIELKSIRIDWNQSNWIQIIKDRLKSIEINQADVKSMEID